MRHHTVDPSPFWHWAGNFRPQLLGLLKTLFLRGAALMAKQLYGYSTSNYGGGGGGATTSLYNSRSVADSYLSADTSLLGATSRYLSADPLSSSSAITSSMLYNPESYSTRIPGISTHSYGPPGVDVGSTGVSTDSLYPGLKRTSSECKKSLTFF